MGTRPPGGRRAQSPFWQTPTEFIKAVLSPYAGGSLLRALPCQTATQSFRGFTPPDGTPFFKGFARQKGPQSVRYAHTKSCVITCFYCLTSFASLGVPPRRCLTRKPLKQENIPVCELRYSLVLMVRCPSESIVFPLCFPATMLIRCIIGATTNTACYVNL